MSLGRRLSTLEGRLAPQSDEADEADAVAHRQMQWQIASRFDRVASALRWQDEQLATTGLAPTDLIGRSPAEQAVRRAMDHAAGHGEWGSVTYCRAFWGALGGEMAAFWARLDAGERP